MLTPERETFRLHAKLPIYKRHLLGAAAIIDRALATVPGEWGVGLSGGKDSTVLIALCHAAGWRGRAFHFRFEETPCENTDLAHLLADRYDRAIVDVLVPGDFTTYDDVGYFFAVPETDRERDAVAAGERRYKSAVEQAAVAAGFAGLFWGMRADESRRRTMSLALTGPVYKAANRATWTACPMHHWSGRDVWAYLLANGMPWLSVYDQAGDRVRERSELTWLGFDELWRRGQGRALRHRDPDLWFRLCERWPGLRDMG